jgi:hypothetical protein
MAKNEMFSILSVVFNCRIASEIVFKLNCKTLWLSFSTLFVPVRFMSFLKRKKRGCWSALVLHRSIIREPIRSLRDARYRSLSRLRIILATSSRGGRDQAYRTITLQTNLFFCISPPPPESIQNTASTILVLLRDTSLLHGMNSAHRWLTIWKLNFLRNSKNFSPPPYFAHV